MEKKDFICFNIYHVKKYFVVFSAIFKVKNFNIILNTPSHQQKLNTHYTIKDTNISTILLHCLSQNKMNYNTVN